MMELTFSNNSFTSNTASQNAGGVFMSNCPGGVTFTNNNVFTSNTITTGNGAGIMAQDFGGALSFINAIFIG